MFMAKKGNFDFFILFKQLEVSIWHKYMCIYKYIRMVKEDGFIKLHLPNYFSSFNNKTWFIFLGARNGSFSLAHFLLLLELS